MQSEYEPKWRSSGIGVLAVNLYDSNYRIDQYVSEQKLELNVVKADKEVQDYFGVKVFPTVYVLDKEGVVLERFVGWHEDRVNRALGLALIRR